MDYYNHWLPKLIRANGVVIMRRIFYAMPEEQVSERLRRHEETHRRQQTKTPFLLFIIRYSAEGAWYMLKYCNYYKAWRSISYEREAIAAEKA